MPSTCCKTILNFTIGRNGPRIRDLQPRVDLTWGWHWLLVGALGALANAAPPSPPAPATQEVPQTSSQGAPDDGFIEFLGTDDVGDAAWWEFLKKAPPRGGNPPATPPQDAKR
jgi:hypothetical protein